MSIHMKCICQCTIEGDANRTNSSPDSSSLYLFSRYFRGRTVLGAVVASLWIACSSITRGPIFIVSMGLGVYGRKLRQLGTKLGLADALPLAPLSFIVGQLQDQGLMFPLQGQLLSFGLISFNWWAHESMWSSPDTLWSNWLRTTSLDLSRECLLTCS